MGLVDKNGLTEAQFLAAYRQKDYPRPSLTADIVLFRRGASGFADQLQVLLIRRGGHPFLGCWALPGGFVNEGEDAAAAARRELAEETGLVGLALEPFGLYSSPGRDPRAWVVSAAFLGVDDAGMRARAGDDAADARWFSLEVTEKGTGVRHLLAQDGDTVLTCEFNLIPQAYSAPRAGMVQAEGFAFDHAQIIADAYLRFTHAIG